MNEAKFCLPPLGLAGDPVLDLHTDIIILRAKTAIDDNLVPRVLSYPPYRAGRREPLERGCIDDCNVLNYSFQPCLCVESLHSICQFPGGFVIG